MCGGQRFRQGQHTLGLPPPVRPRLCRNLPTSSNAILGRCWRLAGGGKEVIGLALRATALGFSFGQLHPAKSGIAVKSAQAYRTNCMDVLTRIKRLVVARQVEFTGKAEQERLADGLSVEDVLESILNANAIKKVLRSQSPDRKSSRDYPIRHREPKLHWTLDLLQRVHSPQRRSRNLLCLHLGKTHNLSLVRAHARRVRLDP